MPLGHGSSHTAPATSRLAVPPRIRFDWPSTACPALNPLERF